MKRIVGVLLALCLTLNLLAIGVAENKAKEKTATPPTHISDSKEISPEQSNRAIQDKENNWPKLDVNKVGYDEWLQSQNGIDEKKENSSNQPYRKFRLFKALNETQSQFPKIEDYMKACKKTSFKKAYSNEKKNADIQLSGKVTEVEELKKNVFRMTIMANKKSTWNILWIKPENEEKIEVNSKITVYGKIDNSFLFENTIFLGLYQKTTKEYMIDVNALLITQRRKK